MLHYLKVMRSAAKNGRFFPKIRYRSEPAPMGSSEIAAQGNPYHRLTREVNWFRHSEHHVPISGLSRSLHILQLSDIHIRTKGPWLETLLSHLTGIQPDILVLTGDVVTTGWDQEAVNQFLKQIPKGRLGSFAVMGNWEYWSGAKPSVWRPFLQKHSITLLVEEAIHLSEITIVGTDDHLAGNSNPTQLLQNLSDHPTLVLTHSPEHFRDLVHPNVDLVLAGHAHGGQMRLPFLGPVWVPKGTGNYIGGWYQQNNSLLFVSRGIGWSVAPLRYRCPPEIASIYLHPA